MKVVFIVPRFHTNLAAAVKALQDAGHEVAVLCPARERAEDHRSLTPTILDPAQLGFAAALRFMRRTKPDVLVTRYTRGPWRSFSYAAALLGVRTIGYDLRPYFDARSRVDAVRDFVRGRGMQRLTPVLGVADGRPADPRAWYIPFPLQPVPAADTRDYVRDGVVRIICVGKLAQPRKQHLLLLDALGTLRDRNFTLTLAGASKVDPPGATQEYYGRVRQAAEHGPLAGRVRVLADVPYESMNDLYLEHDVLVLPARREPLGFAPLEAMACGCVPVVSDECGSAALISSPEEGFVFRADDVGELTSTLQCLLDDPSSISRTGRNAMLAVRAELAPELFVRRFELMAAAGTPPAIEPPGGRRAPDVPRH